MSPRTRPSPAASWRQRFLAIAHQAEADAPRASLPAGLRVRIRRGLLAARRPGPAFGRP